jgi:hypothetical protein
MEANVMNVAKELIQKMIDEIPEKDLTEVIDFIGYIMKKSERELRFEMIKASVSSLEFWNNETDDEVWNNV